MISLDFISGLKMCFYFSFNMDDKWLREQLFYCSILDIHSLPRLTDMLSLCRLLWIIDDNSDHSETRCVLGADPFAGGRRLGHEVGSVPQFCR